MVIVAGSGAASAIAYTNVKGQANQLQAQLAVHLQAGQGELEAAKASLKAANLAHDQALIAEASVHFTTAKLQFTVTRQMADSSHLLRQLESLPAVGNLALSRHTAVDGIADMGVAISDAGLELTNLDSHLIKPGSGSGQQGQTLLTVLDQTSTSLVVVRRLLLRAQRAAAQVDERVLPTAQQPAFVKARATIGSALEAAAEFERLVPVLTELLGANGVRTYLIEQVNAAELRPGGGFIGTFSVLQADHGSIKMIKSGSSVDISEPRAALGQRGYVAPPGPLREFVPNTSWSFMDSNFFPDFPSSAQAAETFAGSRLGTHIDGVISIDFYMVAKMLELTGPLPVPGYALTVDAGNFIPVVIEHDLASDAIHKALLSAIAGPLMTRLSTLPADRMPALIGALNDLAAARHIQTYFNNATVQKEIDQVGWSGVLNPGGKQDYMMEVESNLGGTKANYFVTRHFTVELTRKDATLHHKVTIDLTDNMPFSYRPGEYYHAYIGLFLGATASSGSSNLVGVKYPAPSPPSGTRMIDGWVPLFHGYGHSAKAVFEYDTPWHSDGRGQDQIYWQKQPGTVNDKFDVKWDDGSGHFYSASGDLAADRVITVSSKGLSITAGQPAKAQLPSLSLG
jgi:hypothetical protein